MDSGRRGVQSRIACFPIGCSKTPETQKRLLPRKLMPVGNAPVCVETKDLPARQTGKSNMTSMRDLFRGRLHFSLRPSDSNRPLRCWLSARVLAEVVTSVQTNVSSDKWGLSGDPILHSRSCARQPDGRRRDRRGTFSSSPLLQVKEGRRRPCYQPSLSPGTGRSKEVPRPHRT